jgi:ribA/ribD-fused uncharacterized protein
VDAERFTFFWSGPFSQWFKSAFTLEGQRYVTAEQYMMAEKARLFGDIEVRDAILATPNAREQKALGRQVRHFDADRWNAAARDIVYRGNRAKFLANPKLLEQLLATKGTTIVEASPDDSIWGIGLAEDDPGASDRTKWQGTNWLGEVLTRLRDDLIAQRSGGESASRDREGEAL